MRHLKTLAFLGLVLAVGACQELEVQNTNAPDQARALSEPGDVESLIGSQFRNWFYGYSRQYPAWAFSVAADESSSSWGNLGMQHISSEPRTAFPNETGYAYAAVASGPWFDMYEVISAANDGLRAIEEGLEIEEITRAKAFAKFMQGMGHAYLALTFDRAFIFTEDMDLESTQFELVDYNEVMAAALQMMDEAIAEAGKESFTLPDNWIWNGRTTTNTELIKIMNSYVARFMASVGRTAEERAKANWQEIINRINKGITEEFGVVLDAGVHYSESIKVNGQRFDWFRVDYKTIGPSDKSGGYQAWLAKPVADRVDFDLNSGDKRVQTGGVGSNGTDFWYRRPQNHRADRGTYHFSRYYWWRFPYIRTDNVGWDAIMPMAEMDLLKAEAYIRLGQPDAAVPLINRSRVARGGLPAITKDGPTGPDCLPKKLFDPAGGCADLWQTLMYEKRIENYMIASGVAFWDARGWDILVPGTVLHLPIPAVELETLQMPIYTFGGVGGQGAAK